MALTKYFKITIKDRIFNYKKYFISAAWKRMNFVAEQTGHKHIQINNVYFCRMNLIV